MTDAQAIQNDQRSILAPIFACGFITAALMWTVGFVTHLPGIELSGPAVAAPLIVLQFLGCLMAGRWVTVNRSIMVGAGTGMLVGLINLLVLGSVLASGEGDRANELQSNALMIALTSIGASLGLGAIAGLIGRSMNTKSSGRTLGANRWHARFALAAPIAALPTLLSGGIVTSAEAGLAVPDWPTTFDSNMFLFSLSKMTGGIYYEHAHRLFGALVGLTVLTLFLYTVLRKGVNAKAKLVSLIAFVAVCLQGVIGGIRVTGAAPTDDPNVTADHAGSLALAMVHGVTGQITFALLLVLAAVLSVGWARAPKVDHSDSKVRTFSLVFLILLVIQLILGSATRHTNLGPALHPHILVAIFVMVAAALAGFRTMGQYKQNKTLRKCGAASVHSTGLQFVLGVAAMIVLLLGKDDPTNTPAEVILATAHQANGALVLGAGTLLFLWVRRLVPKA